MMRPPVSLQNFVRDQRGIAGVEFAIMIPMLLIMFFGVVEISNFAMATQRTEKMAHAVADMVSQNDTVTVAQLNTILDASEEIMHPFDFNSNGHVIITSVHRNVGETPKVVWQYEGGGTLKNMNSSFGSTGFNSPLPQGFTLNERETVIIAEVFYQPKAIITDMFELTTPMHKYAFYKPRLGALDSVQKQ